MSKMLTEAYRPRFLADMVGQEKQKKIVGAWLKTGRVPRAILVTGPTSAGKTTISRIIAQSVLCHDPKDGNHCGKCPSCKAIEAGNHMDFIEKNSSMDRGIDAMRDLAQKLFYNPLMGKKKVIVLDECHEITNQAFQALLKPLEEPPERVVIILVTTNPEKIPSTVQGRCSRVALAPVTVDECLGLLQTVSDDIGLATSGITQKHLRHLVMATKAHPRNALHALDQVYAMVQSSGAAGAIEASVISSFIDTVALTDVEQAAATIVRGMLDGKVGASIACAQDAIGSSDELLMQINRFLKQAMLRSVNQKLMDPYFEDTFKELRIFQSKNNREVILNAYSVFVQRYIDCSSRTVSSAEILGEAIARAGFMCKKFLDNAPKEMES